jgi:ribosomal-protein-alanine N-acetyltransferase
MTIKVITGSIARLDEMLAVMTDAFDPRYGEAWSGPQLSGTMAQDGSWTRLAVDDELVVGFTLCRRIVDEAELLLVAVRRQARGRGVGSALMLASANDAAAFGARSMFLEMRHGNVAATRLYHGQGYAEVGRRRDYYRGTAGERFDAITFRRGLGIQP